MKKRMGRKTRRHIRHLSQRLGALLLVFAMMFTLMAQNVSVTVNATASSETAASEDDSDSTDALQSDTQSEEAVNEGTDNDTSDDTDTGSGTDSSADDETSSNDSSSDEGSSDDASSDGDSGSSGEGTGDDTSSDDGTANDGSSTDGTDDDSSSGDNNSGSSDDASTDDGSDDNGSGGDSASYGTGDGSSSDVDGTSDGTADGNTNDSSGTDDSSDDTSDDDDDNDDGDNGNDGSDSGDGGSTNGTSDGDTGGGTSNNNTDGGTSNDGTSNDNTDNGTSGGASGSGDDDDSDIVSSDDSSTSDGGSTNSISLGDGDNSNGDNEDGGTDSDSTVSVTISYASGDASVNVTSSNEAITLTASGDASTGGSNEEDSGDEGSDDEDESDDGSSVVFTLSVSGGYTIEVDSSKISSLGGDLVTVSQVTDSTGSDDDEEEEEGEEEDSSEESVKIKIAVEGSYAGTVSIDLSSAITVKDSNKTEVELNNLSISSIPIKVVQTLDLATLLSASDSSSDSSGSDLNFTGTKTYNGDTDITLTSSYPVYVNGTKNSSGITITVSATATSENVTSSDSAASATINTSSTISLSSSVSGLTASDYYTFSVGSSTTVSDAVTITARPVYIQVTAAKDDEGNTDDITEASVSWATSALSNVTDWVTSAKGVLNGFEVSGITADTSSLSASLVGDCGRSSSDTNGKSTGLVNGDSIDLTNLNLSYTLKTESESLTYTVGTHDDVIGISTDDVSMSGENSDGDSYDYNNYTLVFDSENGYGDLEVTPEGISSYGDISSYITITKSDSSTLTTSSTGSTTWISGSEVLSFSISSSGESDSSDSGLVYDTVYVLNTSDTSSTTASSSMKPVSSYISSSNTSSSVSSDSLTAQIYLAKTTTDSDGDTTVTYCTTPVSLASGLFTVDTAAPTVAISDGSTSSTDAGSTGESTSTHTYSSQTIDSESSGSITITINNYLNNNDSVELTVTDSESGVANVYYYLLDIDSGYSTQSTLAGKVTYLTDSEWTQVMVDSTSGTGTVDISSMSSSSSTDSSGTSSSGPSDGDYLIIIKAVDKAGNTVYVTSDGVVIDNTAPTVDKISITTTSNGSSSSSGSTSTDSSDSVYNTDVAYSVDIYDALMNGVNSDLSEISVTVTRTTTTTGTDGTISSSISTDTASTSTSYTNTYTVDADTIDKADTSLTSGTTLGIIYTTATDSTSGGEYKKYTLTGKVTIGSSSESVTISITATDKSGNTCTAVTKTIQLDPVSPEIYTKASTSDNYYTHAGYTTDGYYNEQQVYYLSIRERDFDTDDITVKISVSNATSSTTLTKTLTQLLSSTDSDCTAYSIACEQVNDTESSSASSGTAYTDSRIVTYKLTFGPSTANSTYDYTFSITSVSVKDKGGNTLVDSSDAETTYTGCAGSFTVDMTSPVIAVAYTDADRETLSVLDNDTYGSSTYVYTNQTVTATVTITERNFDDSKITILQNGTAVSGLTWATDSQDGTVHTATLTFAAGSADTDCSLQITSCTDLAGNSGTYTGTDGSTTYTDGSDDPYPTHAFTIDALSSQPSVSITYYLVETDGTKTDITSSVKAGASSSYYAQEGATIQALVSVTERNFGRTYSGASFDSGQMTLTYTAKDLEGEAVSVTDYSTSAATLSKWTAGTDSSGNTVYTQTFSFTKDANYTLQISYTDLAGNSTSTGTYAFTVDGTDPTGTIYLSSEGDSWSSLFAKIYYTYFKKNTQTLTVSTEDITAGVAKVQYYKYKPASDSTGTLTGLTEGELDEIKSWKTYGSKITVSKDEQTFIYVKITDCSGNVTYLNTQDGIIVDSTSPAKATITINTADPGNGIYQSDVVYTVYAEDTIETDSDGNETWSGLSEVYYEVRKDGSVTQSGYILESGDVETSERIQNITKQLTVNSKKNESNNVVIYVKVTDKAGNTSETTKKIKIDLTAPTVSVTYTDASGEEITPGKKSKKSSSTYLYEDGKVTATIAITEKNFDPDAVSIDLTYVDYDGEEQTVTADDYAGSKGVTWTQSGTTYTASLTFSSSGDYSLDVSCIDLAKNADSTNYQTRYFTIDKKTASISVVYNVASKTKAVTASKKKSSPLYEDETVTATVTITEREFGYASSSSVFQEQMTLTYTALDAEGNAVSTTDYTANADTYSKWKQTDGTYEWVQTFTFKKDANYSLRITYTDLAGNTATYSTRYFTVDTTGAEGEITLTNDDGDYSWTSLAKKIYFAIFRQETQTLKVTADDATGGVKKIQYYKYKATKDSSGTFTGLTTDKLDEITSWKTYKSSGIKVSADAQAFIYVKITDMSGNVTYLNTKQGVIADDTDPDEAAITITTAEPAQGVYDGDVAFTVTATDPTSGSTYAGLSEVYYEIRTDGTVTQSGVLYECETTSARVQTVTRNGTVSADENNSNDVEIYVRVTDKAGNVSESTQDLSIDVTSPVIEVTYNDISASNTDYYNATRIATITVYERNFDVDGVDLVITNSDGSASVGSWSVDSSGTSDENVNTCTVTFAQDSDYTFTLSVTDKAGNTTEYGQTDSFTVDQTDPTISITYDNNSSLTYQGTEYYAATRSATITINEHNFRSSDVTVLVNGTARTVSFGDSGDVHTATVSFEDDGEYDLEVSYTDLAGNEAETQTTDTFVVDLTAPEVTITGVEAGYAYGDEDVVPVVTITDTNYDASGYTLTLTGVGHETFEASSTSQTLTGENGEEITITNFQGVAGDDDVYTLTVLAVDLAGNETEETIKFSVNRDGATFELSDDTEALNGSYVQEADNVVIYAYDCNEITSDEVTITKNGTESVLTEDTDYKVTTSGTEGSWTYIYKIDSSVFADEAVYTVNVHAVDEAGNTMDSATWNDDATAVKFWVDRSIPSTVVNGLDQASYRQSSLTFTIYVSDDYEVSYIVLYVDDVLIDSDDLVLNDDGSYSYTLYESNKRQTVRVYAVDLAGNESEIYETSVMISTSQLALIANWIRMRLLWIILIIILILLLIFFIIWKRRKKDEEEEAQTGTPDPAAKG